MVKASASRALSPEQHTGICHGGNVEFGVANGHARLLWFAKPGWRNGIRRGLKILRPQGRVGSTPTPGTKFCYLSDERRSVKGAELFCVLSFGCCSSRSPSAGSGERLPPLQMRARASGATVSVTVIAVVARIAVPVSIHTPLLITAIPPLMIRGITALPFAPQV